MPQHGGQRHETDPERGEAPVQGQTDGQGPLAQIAGQGEHSPAETAEAGHIGGAGIAAAALSGIDAAEDTGDDQSPRDGSGHIGQRETKDFRHEGNSS